MKTYTKIGLGILVPLFALGVFFSFRSTALAATAPTAFNKGKQIFDNVNYTYRDGKIYATLQDIAAPSIAGGATPSPISLVFSRVGSTSEYVSDKALFCDGTFGASQNKDALPAKILLSGKTSDAVIKATLETTYVLVGGTTRICQDVTKSIDITNKTADASKFPATITYNGKPYYLIDPGYNVYGASATRGIDCFGGSVLLPDATGGKGTIYSGLIYAETSGLTNLATQLISVNTIGPTDTSFITLLNHCYLPDATGNTATTVGINNGVATATKVPAGTTTSTDACSAGVNTSLSWVLCPVIEGMTASADKINDFVSGQLNFDVKANLEGDKDSVHKAWAIIKNLVSIIMVIVMLIMVLGQAVGGGPLDAYTVKKLLPRLVVAIILIQISWNLSIYLIQFANDLGQGIGQLISAPFGGMQALTLPNLIDRLNAGWLVGTDIATVIGTVVVSVLMVLVYWPTALIVALGILVSICVALLTLLVRNALIIICVIIAPLAFLAWVLPGTNTYWKKWKDTFSKTLLLFPMVMGMIYGGRIFAWVAGGLGTAGAFDLLAIFAGFFGPYFFLPKTFKWGGSILTSASNAINKAGETASKRPKAMLEKRREQWASKRHDDSVKRVREGFLEKPWAQYMNKEGLLKSGKAYLYPIDKFRSGAWDPTLGRVKQGGKNAERLGPAGRLLTSKGGGWRRDLARDAYLNEGEKVFQEEKTAAGYRIQRMWEQMVEGGGVVKDDFLQDIIWYGTPFQKKDENGNPRIYKTHDGRIIDPKDFQSELYRRAAMDEMLKLGGRTNFVHIEKEYEESYAPLKEKIDRGEALTHEEEERYSDFRKFMSDNVQTLLPKMTHIYKGILSTADATPENIAGMHGTEIEAMLANFVERIKNANEEANRKVAVVRSNRASYSTEEDFEAAIRVARSGLDKEVGSLNSFMQSYEEAASNPNLMTKLEPGGTRAMKAFVTGDEELQEVIMDSINFGEDGRADLGLKPLAAPEDIMQLVRARSQKTMAALDGALRGDKEGGVIPLKDRTEKTEEETTSENRREAYTGADASIAGSGQGGFRRDPAFSGSPDARNLDPSETPFLHGYGAPQEFSSSPVKVEQQTTAPGGLTQAQINQMAEKFGEKVGEHLAEQTRVIKSVLPKTADDITRNDLPPQAPPATTPDATPTTPPEEPPATS